jgi:two-component system chemotaxis response regulator CheY
MLNIMIVDDSMIIRNTIKKIVEEQGHTVVATARNGREAIDVYEETNPDLVTMDITMPVMDGIHALKRIKKAYKDAKIIMVTSHGEEKLVMEAISYGAKGYILKPITAENIEQTISKVFPDL